jgi:hypothetical protein
MTEKAIFSRKLLYKQNDRAYSDTFETEISAVSAMYAFSWMLEGMQHPITTRARVGIIYDHQDNNNWSPEKVEQEGLFMIESFLMGVSIEAVRERYTDEIINHVEIEDEEETEQSENVLAFRPK